MISRVWFAWARPQDADAFEAFLRDDVFAGMRDKPPSGLLGLDLFRRTSGQDVEFMTILWFSSIEAIRSFAGRDYERAVVSEKDRALLSRFNDTVSHYEVGVHLNMEADRRE